MANNLLIGAIFIILAGGIGIFLLYNFLSSRSDVSYRSLMSNPNSENSSEIRERIRNDETGEEILKLKQNIKKGKKKKAKLTLNEKYFQAGLFTNDEKAEFARLRIIIPCVVVPILTLVAFYFTGFEWTPIALILSILISFQLPFSYLDRKIKARGEDIMFYLPLVIEQISIGVSSSLDINPCLQRVVSMADERDSHNVVTELIRLSTFYVKSGSSLEESLTEVGKLSGHTELKHAFMSLSQVAKHGGEITRQLQELADAVSMQRETRVEEKIKKLELEATLPVALVFIGFIIILLIGFGIQMKGAF